MKQGRREDFPLIKGGQGKTDEQLQEDATYFLVMMILLSAPIAAAILWRWFQWLSA